jgi:glycosyltransferase involved in cell wall biosynthesis
VIELEEITMAESEIIKVAILTTYMPVPSSNGGLEHTRHLIKYLSRRDDVELHILTLAYKNIHYGKNDFEHHTLHIIKKPFGYPVSFPLANLYLKYEIEKINPDIVHVQGAGPIYAPAAALVNHEYPTVLTLLGFGPRGIKFGNRIEIIKYFLIGKASEKYVFSKIPNILVQTSSIVNRVTSMTKSKIYVVPEGIEVEKIRNTPPHDSDEKPEIFLPVRLVRLKGIDILIKSISMVTKSIPDIKFNIAGSGEEETALRSMVKDLKLERHVKFLGYISDEKEINSYYKDCKIVVVPSRWDVEPFAPLNAAASGKPAIVSDMCNSSVIEDGMTGFVFKSEDVEELASKIVKLLTDDKRREEMGKAAMEKAKEYDWSRIVDKKIEIYKEIIADFHERKEKGKNKIKKWKTFIKG